MGRMVALVNDKGRDCFVDPFLEESEIYGSLTRLTARTYVCSVLNTAMRASFYSGSGLLWLNERTGADSIPKLTAAIGKITMLSDAPLDAEAEMKPADAERAKQLLLMLIGWGEEYPDAIWAVG